MNKLIASIRRKSKSPKTKTTQSKTAQSKEKLANTGPDKSGKSTKKRKTKRQRRLENEAKYEWDSEIALHKDTWASYRGMPNWTDEATANADAFMKHYAELGPEGTKAEFKTEVEGWKSPTYADTAFHANPTKNADKNVITCLDESRVILAGDKYINASWAYDFEKNLRRFIIAQAPLPSTLADFWMMIYEQKALAVFALCQQEEKPTGKRADEHVNSIQIWPEKEEETMTIDNITLFRQEWSHIRELCNEEVTMSVKDCKYTCRMRVRHIKGWDKTDPQRIACKILDMIQHMDLVEGDISPRNRDYRPIVVIDDHGGIGLASILVVAEMIGSMLWKGEKNVNVPAIVKWARRCRHGAIRNEDDYVMVVRTIAERINERKEHNPQNKEKFEKAFGIVPKETKEKKRLGTPPAKESKEQVADSPPVGPSKEQVADSPLKEPSKENAGPSKENAGPSKENAGPSKENVADSPSKEPLKEPSKEKIP